MHFFILIIFSLSTCLFATDFSNNNKPKKDVTDTKKKLDISKKDITDTKKKLKISKKDLTDTTKMLDIRTGDLMDTKAMLRKTDFPNQEQMVMLRRILLIKLGGPTNYQIAARKSPAHLKSALKSIWEIYRIDKDIKDVNKSLSKKEITKGRKEFLNEKKSKLNKTKSSHNANVDKMEAYLKKLIKSEAIAATGEFFENVVAFDGGADLIDKLGEAKVRLKKGAKVQTKVHPKDITFYLVKYKGETYFAERNYFKLK